MATIKQSGVIAYLLDGQTLKFMIVTSRSNDSIWIFPKGNVESYLTPSESAQKEAFEEAGVLGAISCEPIGEYKYKKLGNDYSVELYLLKIAKLLKNWPEANQRKRFLATINDCHSLIKDKQLIKISNTAFEFINTQYQKK